MDLMFHVLAMLHTERFHLGEEATELGSGRRRKKEVNTCVGRILDLDRVVLRPLHRNLSFTPIDTILEPTIQRAVF